MDNNKTSFMEQTLEDLLCFGQCGVEIDKEGNVTRTLSQGEIEYLNIVAKDE